MARQLAIQADIVGEMLAEY
jgi:hypothetical protein